VPDRAIDPAFESLIEATWLEILDAHPGSVYGLWRDLRLAYANRHWYGFAADNGGEPAISTRWPVGASVADVVPEVLRWRRRARIEMCLARDVLVEHDVECSSPDTHRVFHETMYPVGHGAGVLVVNSLLVEGPHEPGAGPGRPSRAAYRQQNGMIVQCAACRCVRRRGREVWDWVPAWVAVPPTPITHGMCPRCLGYEYDRL